MDKDITLSHELRSEGVNEQAKRAVRSKRTSEWCERTSEWPITNVSILRSLESLCKAHLFFTDPYDYKNTEKYLMSESYKTMDCELRRPPYKDVSKSYPKRRKNKCPCPECVTDAQKAWAEVHAIKTSS